MSRQKHRGVTSRHTRIKWPDRSMKVLLPTILESSALIGAWKSYFPPYYNQVLQQKHESVTSRHIRNYYRPRPTDRPTDKPTDRPTNRRTWGIIFNYTSNKEKFWSRKIHTTYAILLYHPLLFIGVQQKFINYKKVVLWENMRG